MKIRLASLEMESYAKYQAGKKKKLYAEDDGWIPKDDP